MNKFKLVIFDFDGTLFNTHDAIIHCVIRTFLKFNKVPPSKDVIYETITKGISLEDTFKQLTTENEVKDIQDWIDCYRAIYKQEGHDKTKPFENAYAALEYINNRNIPIVVISNKGVDAITTSLSKYSLNHFITITIGDTKDIKKKPDPMIFNEIIKPKFPDIKPDDVIVIGDTAADLLFAKNIGAHACWAMYGYGIHEQCKQLRSDFVITGLVELQTILRLETDLSCRPEI